MFKDEVGEQRRKREAINAGCGGKVEAEERSQVRIHHDEGAVAARPACRAECATIPRPCPFVSCRYHLFLDVNPRTGRIKFNFPGLEVGQIAVSCALDMAEAGPWTLEEIGGCLNVTRERARQLAEQALSKIRDGLADDD